MSHCITIYTDASVCIRTQTGGWACWIKSAPGETALFSGALKNPVWCSTEAELMAIANGLAVVKKTISPNNATLVFVTDSQMSIDFIALAERHGKKDGVPRSKNSRNKEHRKRLFELAQMIINTVPEGCELRVNKVKAHCNQDGKRSYVNNIVDVAARTKMRDARRKKTIEIPVIG